MTQETNKQNIDNNEKYDPFRRIKIGAGVLFAVAVTGGIIGGVRAADYFATNGPIGYPEFSSKTIPVVVGSGQGIGDAVHQMDGIEKIDDRLAVDYVTSMDVNKKTLANGLQVDETVYIPESTKP